MLKPSAAHVNGAMFATSILDKSIYDYAYLPSGARQLERDSGDWIDLFEESTNFTRPFRFGGLLLLFRRQHSDFNLFFKNFSGAFDVFFRPSQLKGLFNAVLDVNSHVLGILFGKYRIVSLECCKFFVQ